MFYGHSSPHQLMTRSSMALVTCVATGSANRRGPAETTAEWWQLFRIWPSQFWVEPIEPIKIIKSCLKLAF